MSLLAQVASLACSLWRARKKAGGGEEEEGEGGEGRTSMAKEGGLFHSYHSSIWACVLFLPLFGSFSLLHM